MKVLITTDLYTPTVNGVVTSVINLKKELTSLGHDVRVLTLSQSNTSYVEDNVTFIASRNARRIYPGARFALTFDNEHIDKLIGWKPDIIHSQCELSTFRMAINISSRLNIPIVHTYHTVYEDYTHYFSPNKTIGKKIACLFTRKILDYTDSVIAPTEKVKSLLLEYGIKKDINIVPTGIDLSRFSMTMGSDEKAELLRQIGINGDCKILLILGRLAKEKNIEELLTFLSRLEDENIVLLIVGDGPYRDVLEAYVEKLTISNRVFFTGMISPEEVPKYYQLGDVFLSASNSETQGLTYIEALASGVPCLCKKDPCIKDVVKDGINGWQYESFEDFRKKLGHMLDKERHGLLKENAMNSAWREYSSKAFAKSVEQVYERAIEIHYGMIPYPLNF